MSSKLYRDGRCVLFTLEWRAPPADAPRCCEAMAAALEFDCEEHADPFECPDGLIVYNEPFDEYGIVVHDGGADYVLIAHCPWCSAKLPESQRDRWFAALDARHIDPWHDDIPPEFTTAAWRTQSSTDGRRN